jgi:hypothetical protein
MTFLLVDDRARTDGGAARKFEQDVSAIIGYPAAMQDLRGDLP